MQVVIRRAVSGIKMACTVQTVNPSLTKWTAEILQAPLVIWQCSDSMGNRQKHQLQRRTKKGSSDPCHHCHVTSVSCYQLLQINIHSKTTGTNVVPPSLFLDASIFSYVSLDLYIGEWTVDIKVKCVYVFLTLSNCSVVSVMFEKVPWEPNALQHSSLSATDTDTAFCLTLDDKVVLWINKLPQHYFNQFFMNFSISSGSPQATSTPCPPPCPTHRICSSGECFGWEEAESTWRL